MVIHNSRRISVNTHKVVFSELHKGVNMVLFSARSALTEPSVSKVIISGLVVVLWFGDYILWMLVNGILFSRFVDLV